MSNTRRADPGSGFHQERYASSSEYQTGLAANLVAKRCRVIKARGDRELIWFLQYMSHTEAGLQSVAEGLIRDFPKCFSKDIFDAADLLDIPSLKNQREADPQDWSSKLENDLRELCLNPECRFLRDGPYYFSEFKNCLRKYVEKYAEERMKNLVVTDVGQKVIETLNYSLDGECLAIVDGLARMGKTFAAKAWCEARPGRIRYVQVPSTNDDKSFFRAIGRSLGVSSRYSMKGWELSERIEDTLQSGDLMLCFDEAHYLWPQIARIRDTLPRRVNWIMTALVNHGVSVALITTPQFTANLKAVEKSTNWASEQFLGRVSHHEVLPEILSAEDLTGVAEYLLPQADKRSIEGLVLYAQTSSKYLAGIEAAVKRSRFLAQREGRAIPSTHDVRESVKACRVSDESMGHALGKMPRARTPGKTACKPVAAPLQQPGKGFERVSPGRVQTRVQEDALVTV